MTKEVVRCKIEHHAVLFAFHTAHILYTISQTLLEELGSEGRNAVNAAIREYIAIFGSEYLEILDGVYDNHPAPLC